MRPIKFRAWIPDYDSENEEGEYTKWEMCYDLACEEFEPLNDQLKQVEHLMQFTGLLDKNGKEIYEGDIVQFKGGKKLWVVMWDQSTARWVGLSQGYRLNLFNDRSLEVLGNQFENPELLNAHNKA